MPQGIFQRIGETAAQRIYFALSNQRIFILMDVFNGVFQSDDVFTAVSIDIINNRAQSSGFTAAGGAGYQHQTARQHGNGTHLLRQREFVKIQRTAGTYRARCHT